MSCAACQAAIERTVGKMDGVQSAVVNLLANTLTTEYDETKVTNEAICSRIAQIGYGATPEGAAPEAKTSQEKKAAEEAATRWRALVWSAIISVILMVLSMGSMQGWLPESLSGTRGAVPVTLTLFILASIVLLIQRHFYINGFRSLFNGHPNMDALVAIGSSTAYLFGLVSLYLMAFAPLMAIQRKSAVFSATCTSTPPLWCRRSFLSANIWSRAPNQKQRSCHRSGETSSLNRHGDP